MGHNQLMTLTLFVEHEIVGGKTATEEFEGVESFNDPPMTNSLHLSYPDDDDRNEKKLTYGTVVRADSEPTND